jgi:hypothetical protein
MCKQKNAAAVASATTAHHFPPSPEDEDERIAPPLHHAALLGLAGGALRLEGQQRGHGLRGEGRGSRSPVLMCVLEGNVGAVRVPCYTVK